MSGLRLAQVADMRFSFDSSSRFLVAALLVFATACGPATSFDRVAINYQPSANVTTQLPRITSEAVSYENADLSTLNAAGAVYIGEIDLRGERGDGPINGASGPANLIGRASLEAAQRGATHYMLLAGDVEQKPGPQTVVVTQHAAFASNNMEQEVTARFAMLRIEPAQWATLPAALRPQT